MLGRLLRWLRPAPAPAARTYVRMSGCGALWLPMDIHNAEIVVGAGLRHTELIEGYRLDGGRRIRVVMNPLQICYLAEEPLSSGMPT